MEFLTPIIPVVLEPLVSPIIRCLGYLCFRSKVNALSDKVKVLQEEINIVRSCIERGEVTKTYVLGWQSRVETTVAQAETVIHRGEGEAQRGCTLRLMTRYRIGKQAADVTLGLIQLQEERGRFCPTISSLPGLQQIVSSPMEDYFAESRTELLKKVMAALSDPSVAMVGVHGVGGIGKTTLANEVHRQVTQKKLFDKVVLATVTATPELRRIQDEIAEFIIGLKLQESTDNSRASRLNQRLKDISKDTRILIILDDLWDPLELGTVGIPTGDDGQGCKILLTSRRVDLLSDMGSTNNFPIEHLSKKESISLFEKEVVTVMDNKIAEEMVVKCGGFPLLIVTVAGLVRNKGLHAWKDALIQLSKFDNQEIHDKVYSTLKLSYDRLPCDETKSIFLLYGICSRGGNALQDLLRYSLGLGLLKNYTISDARNRLETLIDDLKACSLLDIDRWGELKMHDVVRDMCITHKDQRAFRPKDGNVLKEWPHKGDIGRCDRVSLPYSYIRDLPEDLECPDVEFLLFFSSWHSINISDSTFQRTEKLKVVHFSGINVASLPASLHSLTNLHTLCLEMCHNLDVATVGQLKTLEILSFRGSKLEALPFELGDLTGLKSLDLCSCSQLDFIPANLISKMISLEELLMVDSFDGWEIEESSSRKKARISELNCLSKLASLEICVPNVQALPKDLFKNGLERYVILIGDRRMGFLQKHHSSETTKMLKLKLETDSTDLLQRFRNLLEESETLYLHGINSRNLLYDLDHQGFPKLKKLWIQDSFKLQQIVDCTKQGAATVCFPLLEDLELQRLTNVVTICEGRPSLQSFSKLEILYIFDCNKLKNLMSLSMVRSLSQLKEIDVSSCNEMEALFVEGSDCGFKEDEIVELPRLHRLELRDLPKLKCFLHARESASGSDKATSFFDEKVSLPNLEELRISLIGKIQMIWCSHLPPSSFGKLSSLHIRGCHEIQTVFPYDVVGRFHKLKSLEVSNCNLLEGIYQFRDEDSIDGVIFGSIKLDLSERLTSLNLSNLPELRGFHPDSDAWSWPNLKIVSIQGCPNARIFGEQEASLGSQVPTNVQPFFSTKKVFPTLERMTIDGRIWNSVLESPSWLAYLTQLKSLDLSSWNGILTGASKFGSIPTVRDIMLRVMHSHINQLWSSDGSDFDAGPPAITRLVILDVLDLMHVWRPYSQTEPLLPYLVLLELRYCWDLISFAPSPSASFRSLSTLVVSHCDKLTELIKPSTATTMVNLVKLEIMGCGALKQIVAAENNDDDQTTRECIIFGRLKTLNLIWMGNLEGFCMSSCYSFNFPCLEEFYKFECPSMRIFCNGDITAPKLQNVQSEESRRWEGDLNTTLKQLHEVELQSIRTLRLSRFPELVEIWETKLPFRCFSNLYKLVIDECPLLPVAVPSNILPAVIKCRRLVVEKCDSVEEILDFDGMDQIEYDASLMPLFVFLELIELPKLRHIWNIEDPPEIPCFKNLQELNVHKCSNLTHIFTLTVALGLVHLRQLEVKECALVEVIIKQLEDAETPADWDRSTIFPRLEFAELENLPNLMKFYSGDDNMKCPAMDRVSIVDCPKILLDMESQYLCRSHVVRVKMTPREEVAKLRDWP